MTESELTAWLTFSYVKGITYNNLALILKKTKSAREAAKRISEFTLHNDIIKQVQHPPLQKIEASLNWLNKCPNHHIISLNSGHYPTLLKHIYQPPLILYVKGSLTALKSPQIAIVGSRKASPYGIKHATEFAYGLAEAGFIVTSGLAVGIDSAAHKACLQAKQKTIAILGSGVENIYPRKNQSLSKLIEQQGCLVSEFDLQTPPLRSHFPRRNRIISGLSLGTVVIEASLKSGSLITAHIANQQGRDVFAIPGALNHSQSRGTLSLIQQGAKCTTQISDILEEFDHINIHTAKATQVAPRQKLDSIQQHLLECVEFTVTCVEDIHKISNLPIDTLTATLLSLEWQGHIAKVAGGYIRVR